MKSRASSSRLSCRWGIYHVILGVQIIPTDFSASAAFTEAV
jgi:hypothetical protein